MACNNRRFGILYMYRFLNCAGVAELADATDLGSVSQEWEFESLRPHQRANARRLTDSRQAAGVC